MLIDFTCNSKDGLSKHILRLPENLQHFELWNKNSSTIVDK